MLFVFVRMHAASEHDQHVDAAIRAVVAASRAEPGCVTIHGYRSVRDPHRFVIHSVWRDADAFDTHARLPHTIEFIKTVDPLLAEPREVTRTHEFV
jgi:quinol monooxygenase YgiN